MKPDRRDVFIPLFHQPHFTVNIPFSERIQVAAELGAAASMIRPGRMVTTTVMEPLIIICGWKDAIARARETNRTPWLAFPTSAPDDGSRSVLEILKMKAEGTGDIRRVSFGC